MTIKEFIEAAIEGGWSPYSKNIALGQLSVEDAYVSEMQYHTKEDILLDPKAWEAVGKVKGWGTAAGNDGIGTPPPLDIVVRYDRMISKTSIWPVWLWHMHQMMNALAQGNTLEAYIETL